MGHLPSTRLPAQLSILSEWPALSKHGGCERPGYRAGQVRSAQEDHRRRRKREYCVNIQFIDEEQVRAVLSYHELIPLMRRAPMDYSAGRVLQPLRAVLPIRDHNGWFALMPAAYSDVMGAKLVTFYPDNAASGGHTHQAVIQLFRAD